MNRSLITLLAAPILAAGVLATSAGVTLALPQANAADGGCTSSMAMPQTKAQPANPNMMTRAGQVAMATARADSGAAMAMTSSCTAVTGMPGGGSGRPAR